MSEGSQRFGRPPEKHPATTRRGGESPNFNTREMDSKMKTQERSYQGRSHPIIYLADDFVCSGPHIILVCSNNLTHTLAALTQAFAVHEAAGIRHGSRVQY